MTKTNVQPTPSNSKHHDTPNNKTHVIKFRVTAEEKASLELTCKLLNLSLSTFIRRAIHNVKIEKTVIVAGGGEETLTAVSTLLAQCSRVGTNLNQLARRFNSGGADTEQIRAKLLDELADLTAFRLHAEKVLGELYGNAQNFAFHSIERDSIYHRIVLFLTQVGSIKREDIANGNEHKCFYARFRQSGSSGTESHSGLHTAFEGIYEYLERTAVSVIKHVFSPTAKRETDVQVL
jgi:hypothetical protein